MGAAASATCSADCAARLDQASRLKVGGRWGVWLIADHGGVPCIGGRLALSGT